MEVRLSTLRSLLFAAADIDGGEFQEAKAGQDWEAGKKGIGWVSEPENVRGKEAGSKKAENGSWENDKRIGEGEDQGGQEKQGKEASLDIESPDKAMDHLHQRLPQLPQKREALNDNREWHREPWHPEVSTMSSYHGQGQAKESSQSKT